MTDDKEKDRSLEQELKAKGEALQEQAEVRSRSMVCIKLDAIAARVTSKTDELNLIAQSTGKSVSQQAMQMMVVKDVIKCAEDELWCARYSEREKGEQRMQVFTNTQWQSVDYQQWRDFVKRCAENSDLPEVMTMDTRFKNRLSENLSDNLAKYREMPFMEDGVWLNLQNGTIELRKNGDNILREHRKEDLFYYTLPYAYDPQAECPLWESFLERVLPEKEAREVLREYVGYCLMRTHKYEKLMWMYGLGQNGKSTVLEVLAGLFGLQNVSFVSLEDLSYNRFARSGIEHKLLNISYESDPKININMMKQIASGEPITIEQKYVNPRQTSDYGKLINAGNTLPRSENTFAFMRRMLILPFTVVIPEEERDNDLKIKLKQELPGILNWVIAGVPGLLERGCFTESKLCSSALDKYMLQADSVRLFREEMCEPSEYTTEAKELWQAYQRFCDEDRSLARVGRNSFYERLESLGFRPEWYGNLKRYKIRVKGS